MVSVSMDTCLIRVGLGVNFFPSAFNQGSPNCAAANIVARVVAQASSVFNDQLGYFLLPTILFPRIGTVQDKSILKYSRLFNLAEFEGLKNWKLPLKIMKSKLNLSRLAEYRQDTGKAKTIFLV